MPQLSQRLLWLALKKITFFLSFMLYLNIFVSFKSIQYYKIYIILYTDIINYIPQIHQITLTIHMCQGSGWEVLSL